MEDSIDGSNVQLAEILRHPEDLEKISSLKADFTRRKAAIDAQLKIGLKEQLQVTSSGTGAFSAGQHTLDEIKGELMKIDKLCSESQMMTQEFRDFNLVSKVHRNFTQVEAMRVSIASFPSRLDDLNRYLEDDMRNKQELPNFLTIHYHLSQLRDIEDDTVAQLDRTNDTSTASSLQSQFDRLQSFVEWFDQIVKEVCLDILELVRDGRHSLIVRLAVVIDMEDKQDTKAEALAAARTEYQGVAARLNQMQGHSRRVRGYKTRFLSFIKEVVEAQFDAAKEKFVDEPNKLGKAMVWYFNDLMTVKRGMVDLVPKRWKIFETYTEIYHQSMHDWLIKRVDDTELSPPHMLAIVDWIDKYYAKMAKLGVEASELQPHALDNRESEILREYRQLIVKSVDEWMDRMFVADRKAFVERVAEALDTNEHGYFRTKTLSDLWRMLREQLLVAQESGRHDVSEGVVDAMFAALKVRQVAWQTMVEEDMARYKSPGSEQKSLHVLQDWLLAIANDQIACIDDNEAIGQVSYLSKFQQDLESIVSPGFVTTRAQPEIETLRDGFVDLSTYCITSFVSLIFDVDFRTVLPDFFTPKWYTEYGMKRIITTFEDYISDYQNVLHPSLLEVFVEELSDELLVRYLRSIHNGRSVKFKRTDPFTQKFKDDVLTAFDYFGQWANFADIKAKWKVVDFLVRLLESEKVAVPEVYESFKSEYWDLQISWVECVLRSRDDFDRALWNAVKAKAAQVYANRGPDTVMSKVK